MCQSFCPCKKRLLPSSMLSPDDVIMALSKLPTFFLWDKFFTQSVVELHKCYREHEGHSKNGQPWLCMRKGRLAFADTSAKLNDFKTMALDHDLITTLTCQRFLILLDGFLGHTYVKEHSKTTQTPRYSTAFTGMLYTKWNYLKKYFRVLFCLQ